MQLGVGAGGETAFPALISIIFLYMACEPVESRCSNGRRLGLGYEAWMTNVGRATKESG